MSFEPDDESGAKRCDKNKPGEGESDGLLSPAARDITASDSLAPAGDYNFHLLTSGIDFNDDFAQDARLDKDDKQAKASNPLASLTPSLPPPPPPPPPPSSIRRTTVPLSSSALYFASPQTPCPATPVKLPPRSSPCQDPTPAAVMTALLRTWTGDPTSELYPGQLEVGIDVIRGGKDILLSSSFSSGKTFLSVLPALLDLVCQQNQLLLYLTPFRSIYANLGPRCRKSGIKVHTYPFPPETQVSELSGILLISVEQLLHSTLRESLYSLGQANKISRIVLDEGHTPATQQSFRPSLSHLGLARLAPRPITVVSGTLTPAVRGYIASLFHTDLQHMSQHNLPLRRANIQFKELYSTAWPGSHSQETKRIIEVLKEEAPDFASNPRRSVIIFVGLRTVGEDLKRVLAKMHKDINVKFLSSPQGDEVEKEAMDKISQAWEQGKINVLIATTAGTHALDCAVSPKLSMCFCHIPALTPTLFLSVLDRHSWDLLLWHLPSGCLGSFPSLWTSRTIRTGRQVHHPQKQVRKEQPIPQPARSSLPRPFQVLHPSAPRGDLWRRHICPLRRMHSLPPKEAGPLGPPPSHSFRCRPCSLTYHSRSHSAHPAPSSDPPLHHVQLHLLGQASHPSGHARGGYQKHDQRG